MKKFILIFLLLLLGIGGFFAYQKRVVLHEWMNGRLKEDLPKAESYQPRQRTTSTEDVRNAPIVQKHDLPSSKHLSVPFMTQAPKADWAMPYQEACEEASILMVSGYYRGDSGAYVSSTADEMILDVIALEEKEFGYGPDMTARQTTNLLEAYDSTLQASVFSVTSTESIKRYIAQGIPVIVPADGKTLPNPNFRNGGPIYHMLVITGYTEDEFITNDPGTRKGFDYVYKQEDLMKAIHDWNGGNVATGTPVMIVVEPKEAVGD